jgi:hypothetical protein
MYHDNLRIWAHALNQSPSLPPNEASFAITEGGIVDAIGMQKQLIQFQYLSHIY